MRSRDLRIGHLETQDLARLRSPIGLTLALSLGAGFLALCVWWTLGDLMVAFADDWVTASVTHGQVFGPVLSGRLAWFAMALVALHLSFALLAFGLARLTAAAAPTFAAGRQLWLILAWFVALAAFALMANASWYPASRFSPEDSWLQSGWHGLRPVHVALAALLLPVITLAARASVWQPRPRRALTLVCA